MDMEELWDKLNDAEYQVHQLQERIATNCGWWYNSRYPDFGCRWQKRLDETRTITFDSLEDVIRFESRVEGI